MPTAELSIVKRLEGEILGPESPFVIARTAKRNEWFPIAESAKDIQVVDAESKELAVGHGRLLQASAKGLEEMYTAVKRQVDAIKKPVLDAEKADLAAVNAAKELLAGRILKYNREQDRILAEANRKAQEEARKAAEEQRLAEAIAAEAAGEKEEAEQILNEPSLPLPAIVQDSVQKTQGEVETKRYKATVTDLKALVHAVAAGLVPLQAVLANEPFLNNQARSFNTGLNYPGVTVAPIEKVHFRA